MSFLLDSAIELVVALKGYTLSKEAETALHQLSNEIVRNQKVAEAQKKRKHSCPEWDYMVIDEDSPEFEACLCYEGIDCTDEQLIAEVRRRGFVIRDAQVGREWVGLTDDEIYDYADKFLYSHGSNYGIKSFGKAIEAKLKEKNT